MSKYPIIALEGLSCSGKTTVGKILAKKTNGIYFHSKDGNPSDFAREFFNKTPFVVSYFFYILFFSLSLFKAQRLSKRSIVYMDKSGVWIYSHYKSRNIPDFLFSLLPAYLFKPLNKVLYFYVNEKERIRRLRQRIKEGKASPNDIESIKTGMTIDKYYRSFLSDKVLSVDTNNKTPEKIADEIISLLRLK